jgi:hypothetical protein
METPFSSALIVYILLCLERRCDHWVQVGGLAPNKPLDSADLSRMKQFSAMNKLKNMALRVSRLVRLYSPPCAQ